MYIVSINIYIYIFFFFRLCIHFHILCNIWKYVQARDIRLAWDRNGPGCSPAQGCPTRELALAPLAGRGKPATRKQISTCTEREREGSNPTQVKG